METLVKLNGQTAGRDKLARLLQYLSRVVWHRLQKGNGSSVNNFKNIEYQFSTFRKLLRFGRFVDVLYTTLPLIRDPELLCPDPTIRHTVILSKIANSLFLLADHFLWLGRADICTVNTTKWFRTSNKYWLLSITLNLVRDFYELSCIFKNHKCAIIPQNGIKNFEDLQRSLLTYLILLKLNKNVIIDTIKNGCDFFIPLTALGYMDLSPGAVGWLGVVSSLAGLMVLVEPKLKMYLS